MIPTDLTPPRPVRETKRSFLVLCEDDDQAAYLEWLKSEFGHPLLTIRKLPLGSTTQASVAFAARLRRSEKIKGTHFDETWCMLSLPHQREINPSLELAQRSGVQLALFVGDFSTWIRLHWSIDEAVPQTFVEETSPAGFAAALQDRVEIALHRAEQSRDITTADRLVHALIVSGQAFLTTGSESAQDAREEQSDELELRREGARLFP